jgi:protein-tyrosine phosphatase
MIDLHCHLLPGIDDGAPDRAVIADAWRGWPMADGVTVTACTPHIYPGLYENTGPAIRRAVVALQAQLAEAGIPLQLTHGADTHLTPDLAAGLRQGRVPCVARQPLLSAGAATSCRAASTHGNRVRAARG